MRSFFLFGIEQGNCCFYRVVVSFFLEVFYDQEFQEFGSSTKEQRVYPG